MKVHVDNSNELHDPQQLYQMLCEEVFPHYPVPDPAPESAKSFENSQLLKWRERCGLSPALAVAQLLQQHRALLVVLPGTEDIYQLYDDLEALGLRALIFPSWGSSLYKGIRSQNRLFTERSAVLARVCLWQESEAQSQKQSQAPQLRQEPPLLVLCSLRGMAPVLPPPAEFRCDILRLEIGSTLQPAELARLLSRYGYYQVPRVSLPGEFAMRGEVLDFFPPVELAQLLLRDAAGESAAEGTANQALRVMFGFDEIEALKVFDVSSQISCQQIREFPLFPLKEVLWSEERQARLRGHLEELLLNARPSDFGFTAETGEWQDFWEEQQEELEQLLGQLAHSLKDGELPDVPEFKGEELLFPFAWERAATLQDYMGPDSPVLLWGSQRIERQEEAYRLELEALYQQSLLPFEQQRKGAREGSGREQGDQFGEQHGETLFPELVQRKLLHPDCFAVRMSRVQGSCCMAIAVDELEGPPWPLEFSETLQYHGNLQRFGEDLSTWLSEGYRVAIGCSSTAQARRLRHILQTYQSYQSHAGQLQFFSAELSRGAIFPQQKIALLQEWDILGGGARSKRGKSRSGKRGGGLKRSGAEGENKVSRKEQRIARSQIISSFVELKEGDLVVHVQHGVGRFKGIERIRTTQMERDYLALEYASENTLFVPIEQVNMVQRYIGSDGAKLRLDRIGGKAWQERKAKTRKAVEDLAERLLRLYSRRAAAPGTSYPPDDDLMEEFEADFPYQPTADQLRAVAQIKEDLESPKPMDRLLCGDVGFGKTEVAMRASFKVASSGRQVLLLCPTTILAEQHYQNFQKRFSRFPLRIAMLSRFVEAREQKAVLAALESGKVDILIGTHRILSKDIHLRNLGLIVIDEEQRFGVKHKERLKILKTSVDCLAMSATPIPRTLHMSLVQIRDISMLSTPPGGRHPVETFVREFNPESIAAAIRHELGRGGQVFYLHNRIEGLEEILMFLHDLVPEALIEMAHGQMDSKQLEDIMYRFVHGGFNVLLATAIIENGIDIPNVNTIIIDRADRYGIGQLYQLRGRVGRSDQLAYAYLFYPERSGLSDLALKRLKIISDFTELGSGFKVAMMDLEVRGAGNLLGPEQSGNILAVGFEMYTSMLAKAMQERQYRLELEQKEATDRALPSQDKQGDNQSEVVYSEEISLELDYSGYIPDSYIPDATEKIDLYKRISLIDQAEVLSDFYEELYDRFGNPPEEVHSLLSLAEVRIICRQLGINYLKERRMQVELGFSQARPVPLEQIMRQIESYPKIFRVAPERSNALLIDLAAFMESEKEVAARQAKAQGRKKSGGKHSRNAVYPAETGTAPKAPEINAEDPLLQKTAALRKVLSSLQG